MWPSLRPVVLAAFSENIPVKKGPNLKDIFLLKKQYLILWIWFIKDQLKEKVGMLLFSLKMLPH